MVIPDFLLIFSLIKEVIVDLIFLFQDSIEDLQTYFLFYSPPWEFIQVDFQTCNLNININIYILSINGN